MLCFGVHVIMKSGRPQDVLTQTPVGNLCALPSDSVGFTGPMRLRVSSFRAPDKR